MEKPAKRKKSIPKDKCEVDFINKFSNFINFRKEIIDSRLNFAEQNNISMRIYIFTQSLRWNTFNHHAFVKYRNISSFVEILTLSILHALISILDIYQLILELSRHFNL